MNEIAEILRQLRDARGVSLRLLADRSGLSRRTLSYWEAGTYQPRLPELEMALTALNATAEQRRQALAWVDAPRAAKELRVSQSPIVVAGLDSETLPSGGDLLRAMRHRRGLRLEQVAALIGVSGATVSRWEQSKIAPPADRLDSLLSVLGARNGERDALRAGYGRLMAPLREAPLSAATLGEACEGFARSLYGNREDKLNDLRFLSFEAQAWPLAAKSAEGRRLLASICANYAAFLSGFNRMAEASRYAYRALDLLPRSAISEESALRAAIISARAEVYRGVRPVPHRGLELLRGWRPAEQIPAFHAWMLSDMAEYLLLENNGEAALNLRREACRVAERCKNSDELRLRKLDLAKLEVAAGRAEHALSLISLTAQDTPFRRADIELLFAESLAALEERRNAEIWLELANADIRAHDLTHLHNRADSLAKRF